VNYGHLIRRPLDIVARRPYLWLLGLLAGGATTFGGTNYGHATNSGPHEGPSLAALQNVWNANWEWIVAVLAFLLVLGIVLFVLGCVATGGIIRAAVEHDADREYRLGTAWRAGYQTGWRIAGLRLLTFLLAVAPGFLIGALVLGTVVGAMNSAPAAVGLGLVAAAAILVSMAFWLALGVAFQFAQRLIVLEDGHVAESLSTGFRLIRRHLKEVAFGWLIMIAISIAAGIAFAVLAVVVAIPAVALGFGGWAISGMIGAVVAGSIAVVFFLGILLIAAGAYSAYSSVYWTLLFRNVRGLPAPEARGAVAPAA